MYVEEMSTSSIVQSIATVHQPSIVSAADFGGLHNTISETTQCVCVRACVCVFVYPCIHVCV